MIKKLSDYAPQKPTIAPCDPVSYRTWCHKNRRRTLAVAMKFDGFGVTIVVSVHPQTEVSRLTLTVTASGNPIPLDEDLEEFLLGHFNGHTGTYFVEFISTKQSVHKQIEPSTGNVVPGTHAFYEVVGVWLRKKPMSKQYYTDHNFLMVCWAKSEGANGHERLMNGLEPFTCCVEVEDGVTKFPPGAGIVGCKWYPGVHTPDEFVKLMASITAQAKDPSSSPIEGFIIHFLEPNELQYGPYVDYQSEFTEKHKKHFWVGLKCARYDLAKKCGYVLYNGKEEPTIPFDDNDGDMMAAFCNGKMVWCLVICWYLGTDEQDEVRSVYAKYEMDKDKTTKRKLDDGESSKQVVQSKSDLSQRTWEEVLPKTRPEWVALTKDRQNALMTAVNKGIMPGYGSWDEWTANYIKPNPKLRARLWNMLIVKCEV